MTETSLNRISPFAEGADDGDLFFEGTLQSTLIQTVRKDVSDGVSVIVITGEEGVGKTVLGRQLVEGPPLDTEVIYCDDTVISFEDVVKVVAERFGVRVPDDSRAGISAGLDQISSILEQENQSLLLVCDGAEKIFLATLERVRKMLDRLNVEHVRMQVVFLGRPLLLDHLQQLSICNFAEVPEKRYSLSPLSLAATSGYLKFCLDLMEPVERDAFTPEVISKIHQVSGGRLRAINSLAQEIQNRHRDDASFWVLLDNVEGDTHADGHKSGLLALTVGRMKGLSGRVAAGLGTAFAVVILLYLFAGDEERVEEQLENADQQAVQTVTPEAETAGSLQSNEGTDHQEASAVSNLSSPRNEPPAKVEAEFVPPVSGELPSTLPADQVLEETAEEQKAPADPVMTNEPQPSKQAPGEVEEVTVAATEVERPALQTDEVEAAIKAASELADMAVSGADEEIVDVLEREHGQTPVAAKLLEEREDSPEVAQLQPAEDSVSGVALPEREVTPSAPEAAVDENRSASAGGALLAEEFSQSAAANAEGLEISGDSDMNEAESGDVSFIGLEEPNKVIQVDDTSVIQPKISEVVPKEPAEAPESVEAIPVIRRAGEKKIAVIASEDDVKVVFEETGDGASSQSTGEVKQAPILSEPVLPQQTILDTSGLYARRKAAGEQWRSGRRNTKYTLQLMVLSSATAEQRMNTILSREQYLREADQFYIFEKGENPPEIYVFYGEYDSMTEARAARNLIPAALKQHRPYVLSVAGAMQKVQK